MANEIFGILESAAGCHRVLFQLHLQRHVGMFPDQADPDTDRS
jgi:hypothetical protein